MDLKFLDFEQPIAELEGKIKELRIVGGTKSGVDIAEEIGKLEQKVEQQVTKIYENLDAWQKTQVARHPARPHFLDYIETLVEDFTPLAGDRLYSEDCAIIGGRAGCVVAGRTLLQP